MKKHPLANVNFMLWAMIEDVEAGNFDCIFISDVLGHFSDDQVVQILKVMATWLRT